MDFAEVYRRPTTSAASSDVIPDVTVVIPVKNREATISAAVQSVFAQQGCSIELVVIDDGSTDATSVYLQSLVGRNDVTLVTLESSLGANVARNIGIAHARSDVVAFLDSDDLYLDNRLSAALATLGTYADAGLVLSGFTTEKNGVAHRVFPPAGRYDASELHIAVANYLVPPGTSGITVRKSNAVAAGGFDPSVRRMQDRDFVLRLSRETGGYVLPDALWHKTWSADGISTPLDTHYESLCALFERHPIYQREAANTKDYLIFRHMLQLFKGRHFKALVEVKQHARAHHNLRGGLRMLRRYLKVKKKRRDDGFSSRPQTTFADTFR